MVSMDLWLCWFVVLHGGFLGDADFRSFVAGLVVVFGGDACGGFGWCCAWWLVLLLGEG
jgi:hypothetical protein